MVVAQGAKPGRPRACSTRHPSASRPCSETGQRVSRPPSLPNYGVNATVRPVTPLAVASVAPGRPRALRVALGGQHMKRHVGIWLLAASTWSTALAEVDLLANQSGLWSIEPDGQVARWVEIHNLEEAKATGIFHIEVLGRRHGDPAWKVQHLVPHLAITAAALQRSVVKPLRQGSVYPETFDSAYSTWRTHRDAGGDAPVCDSSVTACMSHGNNRQ